MKYNIKLSIKNTLNDGGGTLICNSIAEGNKNPVTGITYMKGRVQIRIGYADNCSSDYYDEVLDILADGGISIDLINVFPNEKIFTIDSSQKDEVYAILDSVHLQYIKQEECSKLSIIGSGMKGVPGVMSRILKTLRKNNIEVLQTADSHMTIWCLIKDEYIKRAISVLHEEFKL